MISNITYANDISVEDYNALRLSAGWPAIEPGQAQAGLIGSAIVVAANDGDKTIGTGRLVWDGGCAALIKDVLVLPEYQNMGIGTAIMERILLRLKDSLKPGWAVSVDLMAAVGKEGFYEKFGFSSRPRHNRGPGMDMLITHAN